MQISMNLGVPIKDEIVEQLPWLLDELGFRVVEERYTPDSFGNSLVILESVAFRLRLVRDRGQIFADIAAPSNPDKWWNLEHVCEIILGHNIELHFELSVVAELLRRNFLALADYLGPKFPEAKLELERRAAEREKAIRNRLCH